MKPLSVTSLGIVVFLFLQNNISANSFLNSNSLRNTPFSISHFSFFQSDTSIIGEKNDLENEEITNSSNNPTDYAVALEKTKQIQAIYAKERGAKLDWQERGPNNFGGTTRAILVDMNDTSGKTVFAGSMYGGLWKCKDITAENPIWENINLSISNLSVNAIVQDSKNPNTLYLGGGNMYLDNITGIGILKSTDGGKTWKLLDNTKNSNFKFVNKIVIHPETNYIFVGTRSGLFRSKDNGETWSNVLYGQICDVEYSSLGYIYVSKSNSIFRSSSGDLSSFNNLSFSFNSLFSSISRIEFNICKKFPNTIYAVCDSNFSKTILVKSNDGGLNWSNVNSIWPNNIDISSSYGWYCKDISVSPSDTNILWVGGLKLGKSINGGKTFNYVSGNISEYQQMILYNPFKENMMLFGNDGGIFYTNNSNEKNTIVVSKNNSYNTSTLNSVAIHPDTLSNNFTYGMFDNGTLKSNSLGIGSALNYIGGDGLHCFIDQKNPNFQMFDIWNGYYIFSKDNCKSYYKTVDFNGYYDSPADYDNINGTLYVSDVFRDLNYFNVRKDEPIKNVKFKNKNLNINIIKCDPNKAGRVYIGYFNGKIDVIENVLENDTFANNVELGNISEYGIISSIDIEDGNENHLIIALNNYGLKNNIFESFDRGKTWIGVEGTAVANEKRFPDMPVKWVIFAPGDATKALIATELGVWHTEKLDGANTEWIPPSSTNGIPIVRTEMLQYRKSDNLIVAATFGRGLWSTNAFSPLIVKFLSDNVAYTNKAVSFQNITINGSSYKWDFGDGNTSTAKNPSYKYKKSGVFKVTLTADGVKSYTKQIVVLPKLTAYPYEFEVAEINRDNENSNIEFAIDTKSGAELKAIENGNNRKYDFKLNIDDQNRNEIGKNTHSILYFPNYDFSENANYSLFFKSKYNFNPQNGGFYFEYSIDNGENWQHLGEKSLNWYNSIGNENVFEKNQSIFSGEKPELTNYHLDLSFLSGNEQVAIRLIAKSEYLSQNNCLELSSLSLSKNTLLNNITLIEEEQFRTFPNPFTNKINITSLNHFKGEIEVKLFNLNGKLQFAKSLTFNDSNTIELNNLISGEYILQLKKNDKILLNKKIICMEK